MKKALALSALPLVLLLGAAIQSPNSITSQITNLASQITSLSDQNTVQHAQISSLISTTGLRKYYLTKTINFGGGALTACDAGYHMASLWEIQNPTSLRYNTQLGIITDDSGFGPPIIQLNKDPRPGFDFTGWARTGAARATANTGGQPNCDAWTSSSLSDFGTVAGFNLDSTTHTLSLVTGNGPCGFAKPVWCVQD